MASRLLPLIGLLGCSEYDFHGDKGTEPPGEPETAPHIVVRPAAVDLGVVAEGAFGEEVVTIANEGDAWLQVTGLSLSVEGSWSIVAAGDDLLAPGASTEVFLGWEATADASGVDALAVASDDVEQPVVEVPLSWVLSDEDLPPGELRITPPSHDFGVVDVGLTESVRFTVENVGEGPLTVSDVGFSATSSELALSPVSEALPWSLGPGEAQEVVVTYTPTDDIADEGAVLALSDGGDQQADVVGTGKAFEGFSTGWYVWDPRIPVPTTTDGSYVVDHHGDEDSYFYENSGMHGMTASTDIAGDFAILRDYVIANAGAPIVPSGPFEWEESSSVSQFNEATFTYFLCDFYLPADADVTEWTIESGSVDDGIRVIVNGHILGHQKLGQTSGRWELNHAVPGAVNTLLIILVDDAAVNKSVRNLGFWYDGALVEG